MILGQYAICRSVIAKHKVANHVTLRLAIHDLKNLMLRITYVSHILKIIYSFIHSGESQMIASQCWFSILADVMYFVTIFLPKSDEERYMILRH